MISKRTLLPVIDPARCTACGRCVAACSAHVLSLEARGWVKSSTLHDPGACTGCGACEAACPFGAMVMLEGTAVRRWPADESAGSLGDTRCSPLLPPPSNLADGREEGKRPPDSR